MPLVFNFGCFLPKAAGEQQIGSSIPGCRAGAKGDEAQSCFWSCCLGRPRGREVYLSLYLLSKWHRDTRLYHFDEQCAVVGCCTAVGLSSESLSCLGKQRPTPRNSASRPSSTDPILCADSGLGLLSLPRPCSAEGLYHCKTCTCSDAIKPQ